MKHQFRLFLLQFLFAIFYIFDASCSVSTENSSDHTINPIDFFYKTSYGGWCFYIPKKQLPFTSLAFNSNPEVGPSDASKNDLNILFQQAPFSVGTVGGYSIEWDDKGDPIIADPEYNNVTTESCIKSFANMLKYKNY